MTTYQIVMALFGACLMYLGLGFGAFGHVLRLDDEGRSRLLIKMCRGFIYSGVIVLLAMMMTAYKHL